MVWLTSSEDNKKQHAVTTALVTLHLPMYVTIHLAPRQLSCTALILQSAHKKTDPITKPTDADI